MYVDKGLTQPEIADILGCSGPYLCRLMKDMDIETRSKGARAGEDHPKWADGGSSRYYGSWDKAKKKALERDEYTCRSCGGTREDYKHRTVSGLEVHHHKPYSAFEDKTEANKLSNLITLCVECHPKYEKGIHGPLAGIKW